MLRELEDINVRDILSAGLNEKGWWKLADFGRWRDGITGSEFLLKSFQSSKVEIRTFNIENNKPGYRILKDSEDQKKALLGTGVEFEFTGGSYGPFMKVEIYGQKNLLFKFIRKIGGGSDGCDGGVVLLSPPGNRPSEQNWLRSIVIGADQKNITFVLGDNPTEGKGGNYHARTYRRVFNLEIMAVPYDLP